MIFSEVAGSNLLSVKGMNNSQRFLCYFGVIALLSAYSCTQSGDPSPDRIGQAYFPLRTGEVRLYSVVEKVWRNNAITQIREYQLRETVRESFINLEGEISYALERAKKPAGSNEWTIDSLWTARIDANRAVVVQNNRPVIVLVFPVQENKTWNANAMNDHEMDQYRMEGIGRSFETVPGIPGSGNTVTVIQSDNDDIVVETDLRKEVYGYETGLIFKDIVNKKFEGFGANRIVVSGIEYSQHLINYESPQ
jgi:hypothetical protein